MIYQITSPAWEGYIEIEFNLAGYMIRTDTKQADLSEEQQKWFLIKMPRELSELQRVIEGTTAKLSEVNGNITFEMFWNRYDEKLRSSKKKALKIWNRMHVIDQNKAFKFIQKYETSIPSGVAKKYAETYLNAELWNN